MSARRDVALALVMAEHAIAERYACRLLGVNRSTYRYEPRPDRNAKTAGGAEGSTFDSR